MLLEPGENRHFRLGENSQFQPIIIANPGYLEASLKWIAD